MNGASLSRLSLRERMWGGRVAAPSVKAGAERRKKTVLQALLSHSFTSLIQRRKVAPNGPPGS
ncbi:MAG: hypothetical protein PsegKO_11900 [Pseudohongiellaceae bacterium]